MKIAFKKAFPYTVPILLGYLFLGIAFGLLASEVGLSAIQTGLISAVIYAGSLQYALIPIFANPISLISIAIFSLSINIRYLFYGLTLIRPFKKTKHKLFFIHGLSDEAFALITSLKTPKNVKREDFILAIEILSYIYWVFACFLGGLFGDFFDINTKGLDFVLIAMFMALFVGNIKEPKKVIPSIIGIIIPFICLLIFGSGSFMIPSIVIIVIVLLFFRKQIEENNYAKFY
ncbi:AzlC family ABC transporter permease [Anaerococcus sp. AGMB00486]|uniref:AzlC family ABC transporter permease n=1 Tax=Anaerococcus faecalis TaxID=2742993 RepID=A0ABX2NB76_9FIRM|nr:MULTISPECIES: AzlC family ABC transporter permease [Anaerococcus]MDY3006288.1 AzlC family ABC transporter permease [Anaerococcus porci]NVF11908.1 AzlC family ABC transporter permease [Anaerococcus faecalis]